MPPARNMRSPPSTRLRRSIPRQRPSTTNRLQSGHEKSRALYERPGFFVLSLRSACVNEAQSLVGVAPAVIQFVPDLDHAPVALIRDVLDPYVAGDLAAAPTADRPVGVIDLDQALVELLGDD